MAVDDVMEDVMDDVIKQPTLNSNPKTLGKIKQVWDGKEAAMKHIAWMKASCLREMISR